ncbi:hypothetical protein HMPREF9065_00032 [Aggregatibacter sp. oral taxon 458 str. W10330]|nr:hypothetical protein HMPREF9065_00032 [Aggregatibacter sp. oral taxon 458 str. W10330]
MVCVVDHRAEHFQCVACILMHDQTTHGTLFNPSGDSRFRTWRATNDFPHEHFYSCNKLHATGA